jgi:F420-0:gamma-glutamyl ligase
MMVRLPYFSGESAVFEPAGPLREDPACSGAPSELRAPGTCVGRIRTDDGRTYELICQEAARVVFHPGLSERHDLRPGESIAEVRSLSAAMDADLLTLWMSSHAAFRAWQSQAGEGGHVANQVVGIPAEIAEHCGIEGLVDALNGADLGDGDILVIADKCVSFAHGRVFPRSHLDGQDPKFLDPHSRRDYARRLSHSLGHPVSERQLLCIDFVGSDRASISIGDHNRVCAAVASAIAERFGPTLDIVISDSDTGVDYGMPLIGAATVGASSLGATAGLSPYEAMRVSAAAEILRGHGKRVPFVLCKTNPRNARRPHAGSARHYPDTFDLSREPLLHHGLKNTCYWKGG